MSALEKMLVDAQKDLAAGTIEARAKARAEAQERVNNLLGPMGGGKRKLQPKQMQTLRQLFGTATPGTPSGVGSAFRVSGFAREAISGGIDGALSAEAQATLTELLPEVAALAPSERPPSDDSLAALERLLVSSSVEVLAATPPPPPPERKYRVTALEQLLVDAQKDLSTGASHQKLAERQQSLRSLASPSALEEAAAGGAAPEGVTLTAEARQTLRQLLAASPTAPPDTAEANMSRGSVVRGLTSASLAASPEELELPRPASADETDEALTAQPPRGPAASGPTQDERRMQAKAAAVQEGAAVSAAKDYLQAVSETTHMASNLLQWTRDVRSS